MKLNWHKTFAFFHWHNPIDSTTALLVSPDVAINGLMTNLYPQLQFQSPRDLLADYLSPKQISDHAAHSTIQLLTLLLSAPLDGQTCPLALCRAIACQLSTDGVGWSSSRSGNLRLSVPFCLQRLNLVFFPISQLLMCHVSSPNVVVHRDTAYRQLALLSPSVGE